MKFLLLVSFEVMNDWWIVYFVKRLFDSTVISVFACMHSSFSEHTISSRFSDLDVFHLFLDMVMLDFMFQHFL